MIHPGLMLQKLVVDMDGVKQSYLGTSGNTCQVIFING